MREQGSVFYEGSGDLALFSVWLVGRTGLPRASAPLRRSGGRGSPIEPSQSDASKSPWRGADWCDSVLLRQGGWRWRVRAGLFDTDERLRWLSAAGDPLERLAAVVDFELFRPELDAAFGHSDRAKGGRPPYDPVLMFRILVLQSLYTLSDDQAEYPLRDRLSFMRFAGLALHDPVPDAKTIWLFCEQLVRAGAFDRLFARFDAALCERGYLAKGGQIVDATIVEVRRPRLAQAE